MAELHSSKRQSCVEPSVTSTEQRQTQTSPRLTRQIFVWSFHWSRFCNIPRASPFFIFYVRKKKMIVKDCICEKLWVRFQIWRPHWDNLTNCSPQATKTTTNLWFNILCMWYNSRELELTHVYVDGVYRNILSRGLRHASVPRGFLLCWYMQMKWNTIAQILTQLQFCINVLKPWHKKNPSRTLKRFRERSYSERCSVTWKQQLDEMNIPPGPGCCFWYSYRHATGRRLNKHYSVVKNTTSTSSSSAQWPPPNHKSVHFC